MHTPFFSILNVFKISGIRWEAHLLKFLSSLNVTNTQSFYQVPAEFQAEIETPVDSVFSSQGDFPSILLGVMSTPSFSSS